MKMPKGTNKRLIAEKYIVSVRFRIPSRLMYRNRKFANSSEEKRIIQLQAPKVIRKRNLSSMLILLAKGGIDLTLVVVIFIYRSASAFPAGLASWRADGY